MLEMLTDCGPQRKAAASLLRLPVASPRQGDTTAIAYYPMPCRANHGSQPRPLRRPGTIDSIHVPHIAQCYTNFKVGSDYDTVAVVV